MDQPDNVVALRGGAPLQPGDTSVTPELLNLLKRMVVRAKEGDIVGLAVVYITRDGSLGLKQLNDGGVNGPALVGAMSQATHQMVSQARDVR